MVTYSGKKSSRKAFLQFVLWCSSVCLFAYISLATQLFLESLSLRFWLIINLAFSCLITWFIQRIMRTDGSSKWLPQLALATTMTIITFLFADTAYNVWINRFATPLPFQFYHTPNTGALEINLGLPRYDAGFDGRNKPLVIVGGEIFGELVPPVLVDDPGFANAVVRSRYVEYRLDKFGFRNAESTLPQAETIAMGDSFVFGASIEDEKTWVRKLEQKLRSRDSSATIYNLGESGTSPLGQSKRLQDLLAAKSVRPRRIIWMIFGGNDLAADQTDEFAGDTSQILDNTILIAVVRGLEAIRGDSIIGRMRSGRLARLKYPANYYYKQQLLPAPLYHSPALGAKLFYPPYIAEARRSPADVLADPQLRDVARAFSTVHEIADDLGAEVLIAFAPSAEHLLGGQFTDYPKTNVPTFAGWIQQTAEAEGFAFLDLSDVLAQTSENVMPYFSDDTHWNEAGHAAAASAIHSHLHSAVR